MVEKDEDPRLTFLGRTACLKIPCDMRRIRMEPAGYPPKNTEEINAVNVLESLFDSSRVKSDIKVLDKVPNKDGSVELVDEKERPIGELIVQVKKIPDGSLKFDCPIELVAYSTRVSSPFLLICVDVGKNKAYWKHVTPVMAGVKPRQKTFIVKFQPIVDEVGKNFPYFDRWLDLCRDYQRRISEFPSLEKRLEEEFGLAGLRHDDRQLFQQYIEEVNVLLDVDFPIVKHEFFADTWKLGVNVHRVDSDVISFSIYNITLGKNAPLVLHTPAPSEAPILRTENGEILNGITSFHLEGTGRTNEIATQWNLRDSFEGPMGEARKFVLKYVRKMLEGKYLHVHGRHQSEELLSWFAREYQHCMGLSDGDTLSVSEVSYGLNVFLPAWYSLALPRVISYWQEHFPDALRSVRFPYFEQMANSGSAVAHPSEEEVRKVIRSGAIAKNYPIRTDEFSYNALHQALDFLVAEGVQKIERPDRPWSKVAGRVWNCYSVEDLKHNAIKMWQGASEDYPAFVKGNRFGRFESQILNREVAFVISADTREWEKDKNPPAVTTFCVENDDRSLTPTTFVDLALDKDICIPEEDVLNFNGVRRKLITRSNSFLPHLNKRCRTRALLYDWLKKDLENRFGKF